MQEKLPTFYTITLAHLMFLSYKVLVFLESNRKKINHNFETVGWVFLFFLSSSQYPEDKQQHPLNMESRGTGNQLVCGHRV